VNTMAPSALFVRLAAQHLGRQPVRTVLLALAVAVGGGAVFCASVLRESIRTSMDVSLDRMGADLMVVPETTTVNLSAALLTVEPTPHTFDQATEAQIARLPGVQGAAPQRYVALPGAGKSHESNDLIAFDPALDFTVQPWVVEKLDRPFRRGDVIVGGRGGESVGSDVRLFAWTFTVDGKLALTGVGPFERAMFVSFDTGADIAAAARETTGQAVVDAGADRCSAVLVRLNVGATPEQFRFAAARLTGVQVVGGNSLNTTVRQGISTILNGAIIFTILTLLTSALMVGAIYTSVLEERRRELGLLLAVGMRPSQVIRLILGESGLTTGLGGACGRVPGLARPFLVPRH